MYLSDLERIRTQNNGKILLVRRGMLYFFIYDTKPEHHIIAVLKTIESAKLVFEKILRENKFVACLYLARVHSDEMGMLGDPMVLSSYSKDDNVTKIYKTIYM